ncbi:hypothetical protein TSUD_278480 [Trifolium subterraneum]|uniref:Uncharacterized protein n=1 Tax=Trifolium subterraneum TaxID=3900 RepID=A0A2Z6M8G9_TRISU|nr:hypothetical protein TSUD_278480 [Trifolium subterraneum]
MIFHLLASASLFAPPPPHRKLVNYQQQQQPLAIKILTLNCCYERKRGDADAGKDSSSELLSTNRLCRLFEDEAVFK